MVKKECKEKKPAYESYSEQERKEKERIKRRGKQTILVGY